MPLIRRRSAIISAIRKVVARPSITVAPAMLLNSGIGEQQVQRHLAGDQHVSAALLHHALTGLFDAGDNVRAQGRIAVRGGDLLKRHAGGADADEGFRQAHVTDEVGPEIRPLGVEEQHAEAAAVEAGHAEGGVAVTDHGDVHQGADLAQHRAGHAGQHHGVEALALGFQPGGDPLVAVQPVGIAEGDVGTGIVGRERAGDEAVQHHFGIGAHDTPDACLE